MEAQAVETIGLVALVAILVEVIKRGGEGLLPHRFLPAIAVLIGATTGYLWDGGIVNGIVAGAAASGIYDVVKKTGIDTIKSIQGK